MARRAAALALLLVAGAAAALLLLPRRAEPPPEPGERSIVARAPGVVVALRAGAFTVTNEVGTWTVLAECRADATTTVGPGYVSRLVTRGGEAIVDDRAPPAPLNDPGHGGLGAFAWHHARGRPGELRLTRANAWEVSGRVCAAGNGGFGVSGARVLEPPHRRDGGVAFAVEVGFSDEWTHPQPLMRVRYRYVAERDRLRTWIDATELCGEGRCGRTALRAFLKEPKLAAAVRSAAGLPYSRAAIFDGDGRLRCIYVSGGPPSGPVLDTGQCAHGERSVVRFDAGTAASGGDGGCDRVPCLRVEMRAAPHAPWAGAADGFDAWAADAAARPAALRRDTPSIDGVLWSCHGGSPDGDLVRRWETIARIDDAGRHTALGVLFTAWQGGRGGYDCEPLLRTFGRHGATWRAYAEYRTDEVG